MESCYQRSLKFADQVVLLSVLVYFFVCNFIWYRMHLHWSHSKSLMFEFYKTIVLWWKLFFYIKGTLKQIWKSPTVFVFIWKQYPENLAFLILRILKLFAWEVCEFLKKHANFYLIQIFVNFFFETLHMSHVRLSQNVKGVLMRNLWHIIFLWRRRYWQILKSALSFRT